MNTCKELKIYRCSVCGNIMVKIKDADMTPTCCGKMMAELQAESTDGALEKHVPEYERKGNMVCVVVGAVEHPMTEVHHIEFIILQTTKGFHVHYLCNTGCDVSTTPSPSNINGAVPKTCFYLSGGEEPVAIYEYCNLHGLYVRKCQGRL